MCREVQLPQQELLEIGLHWTTCMAEPTIRWSNNIPEALRAVSLYVAFYYLGGNRVACLGET
jgi:hypothetical protein